MAKDHATFKHTPAVPQSRRGASHAADPGKHPIPTARWLLGAVLLTVLIAAICLYGAVCVLFWYGQWQVVFHPSRTITTTPASLGLPYDDIHFGATETGVLELTGWWIGAGPGARYAGSTLLFLRDGSGSLSASAAQLKALHQLGINILAFDYRGFGASAKIHPSEERINQDADSAWLYLTDTRHIAPESIVIYGEKLGAATAVECALRHPQTAGVILEDLQPPALQLLAQNSSLRWLPEKLIFHDRFDPTQGLARLTVPKLFLTPLPAPSASMAPLYYAEAAAPKSRVAIDAGPTGQPLYLDKDYLPALNQFLLRLQGPR
jgi:pimeloyl-ACP methyl ester carboxylesterase